MHAIATTLTVEYCLFKNQGSGLWMIFNVYYMPYY